MNLHNITQKNLFDSYSGSSPVISRCYSSKAPVNAFLTTPLSGKSLLNMNKYLGNGSDFNRKDRRLQPLVSMKMPPLHRNSSYGDIGDPLVKIVGGFVGSKSQAGITNHRGREYSLWDVIVDKIFEIMEHPVSKQSQANGKKSFANSNATSYSPNMEEFTMIGVGCLSDMNCQLSLSSKCNRRCTSPTRNLKKFQSDSSNVPNALPTKPDCSVPVDSSLLRKNVEDSVTFIPNGSSDPIQITPLAPETLAKPEILEKSVQNVDESSFSKEYYHFSESEDDLPRGDILSSSCDSESTDTPSPRKTPFRTISECSVDSDDSFIVFESGEDDNVLQCQYSDDEDDSDEDMDEIDHYVLLPHNDDLAPHEPMLTRLEEANHKWNSFYKDSTPTNTEKRVSFASGKALTKIKPLITWNFAHRAARVGPWEMYHRDSERFKLRIASLSSVISPVLAESHRKKMFDERFQI